MSPSPRIYARLDVPEKCLHGTPLFTRASISLNIINDATLTRTHGPGIESQGLATPELHAARSRGRLRVANLHIISSTRYRA